MKKQYIYPQNLKSESKLWLWNLRDVVIIGIALLISVLALAQLKLYLPLALTLVYMFLTIRPDENTILDFIVKAARYFITTQQKFIWQEADIGTHMKRGE